MTWYGNYVGQELSSELRKCIAQETVLQMEEDNSTVLNATVEMLVDSGDITNEEETKKLLDEIAHMDEEQEQKFCEELDKEIVSHYGHNLHIFGANERLRRASDLF